MEPEINDVHIAKGDSARILPTLSTVRMALFKQGSGKSSLSDLVRFFIFFFFGSFEFRIWQRAAARNSGAKNPSPCDDLFD
jgi:hypothetical protein